MRHLSTLICLATALAATSPTATAGDYRMVVTGQVFFTLPDPLTGPFAHIVVGAPFEVRAEVIDNPLIVTAGQWLYPLDTSTGGTTIAGVTFSYVPLFGDLLIIDDFVSGDAIALAAQLDVSTMQVSQGISFADPTLASLTSANIADLVGTTLVPDPNQAITMIGSIQIGNGQGFVGLGITEMRFELGSGGGGGGGGFGTPYCSAVPNSTGSAGETRGSGSLDVTANDVTLVARQLPLSSFGFFLTSRTQGFSAQPGGSQGNLCLGGNIGRYVGPGQIMNSGVSGSFSLPLDLTQMPTPTGPVAAQAGQTWNFTAWFRDSVGGSATSNFTDGLSVTFQ